MLAEPSDYDISVTSQLSGAHVFGLIRIRDPCSSAPALLRALPHRRSLTSRRKFQ